jgi:hypothetical protein
MLFMVDTKDLNTARKGVRELVSGMNDLVYDIEQGAAELVADRAQPMVPRLSGAARASVKALDYAGGPSVVGGRGLDYFAWLNYGGAAGRQHATKRSKVQDGRYLYPAYERSENQIEDLMADKLMAALRDAGLA